MVSTVPGGLETPEFIDLRKKTREGTETEEATGPKELYHVIPERETSAKGFMGSSTAYDLSTVGKGPGPSVLGAEDRGTKVCLSQAQLKKRYEEQQAQQNRVHVPGANADRSGFEDVVAGETQKRARKAAATKGKEKEKEKFKF